MANGRVVLRDSAGATIVSQTTAVATALHRFDLGKTERRRLLHHNISDLRGARRGARKLHHSRHPCIPGKDLEMYKRTVKWISSALK